MPTIKGHLDQSRKKQSSTQPLQHEASSTVDPNNDAFPLSPPSGTRSHFCFSACMPNAGQIFNQTGRLISPSSTGSNKLLILYDYDSNYIHAEPMKNKTASKILATYKRAHSLFVKAGLGPVLQRLDNERCSILKEFMRSEDADFQLVPPHIHRQNAAERAIRTFKNHFIAGLCSTDENLPLHLWDRLLSQAPQSPAPIPFEPQAFGPCPPPRFLRL
jgi:hypothetical protein